MASKHHNGGSSGLWMKLFQSIADLRIENAGTKRAISSLTTRFDRSDRVLGKMGRVILKLAAEQRERFAEYDERLARLEARSEG